MTAIATIVNPFNNEQGKTQLHEWKLSDKDDDKRPIATSAFYEKTNLFALFDPVLKLKWLVYQRDDNSISLWSFKNKKDCIISESKYRARKGTPLTACIVPADEAKGRPAHIYIYFYIHIDSDAVNEPWRSRSENKYKLFPPMAIYNAWDFHLKSKEYDSPGCSNISFCDRRLSCGSDASWDLVEEPHLIVPEGSKLAEKGGGHNVTVISRESCLYTFLLFSASQQIKLQHRPEPGREVKFTADDEWQAWLRRILGASAAVLKVTFASWPPNIKEFGDYEIATTRWRLLGLLEEKNESLF
ncbi:hypothetical protein HYQ44_020326 [Verticillium longisporum]|nr:hypothetical protein HYQ44_020326 [Verticillium longisporum]